MPSAWCSPIRPLADAAAADRKREAGRDISRHPLLGIPIAVKDDVDVAGVPTRFGADGEVRTAQTDAEVVRRLRAAGAVIVGKTNTCELGQWPFTSGPAFGHTRNPWSREHTPGGSSGGSAAAVAAGLVAAAIGSDGAGSVRIPAAWTHLVGIKPQRGRISTWPLPEAFNGITVNGVLARTVTDAALVLDAASGNADGDLHKPPPVRVSDYVGARARAVADRVVHEVSVQRFRANLHPEIRAALEAVAGQLEQLGHTVVAADPDYGLRMSWNFLARSTVGTAGMGRTARPRRHAGQAHAGQHAGWAGCCRRTCCARPAPARPQSQRRVGWIFNLADVVLAPTTAQPPPQVARLRPPRRAGHRPRDDPRLPGDLAVEPAGLAVDQCPGRIHLRRPADRRAVDGPGQQRTAADLAGRRAGGDQRLGGQAAGDLVGHRTRGSTGRPRRSDRYGPIADEVA